jgi:Glycosyl transferase family 2
VSLLGSLPLVSSKAKGWPWKEETDPSVYAGRTDWPRISIVTPSFNQAQFLEETIRSVLLQNYPNLEYIVIDGGSTDGSVEIIKKYEPWIDYWVSEKDRGQSHAINKGLERCNGVWFNWLNSDDYFFPGALHALITKAKKERSKIVSGQTMNIGMGIANSCYSTKVRADWPDTLFFLQVNQPGSLLDLPEVRKAGGVREDLRLCMDLDLWLRILWRGGSEILGQTDKRIAAYRYHDDSKTCMAEDAFALEEYGLLADLAEQAGVDTELVPELRKLREACGPKRMSLNGPPKKEVTTADAERAWFGRLLIEDSLLYRAYRKLCQPSERPRSLIRILGELRAQLQKDFPEKVWDISRTALIRAMQIEKRLNMATVWKVLRLGAGPKEWRELVRLAIRP